MTEWLDDNEGWVNNHAHSCPIAEDVLVDVKLDSVYEPMLGGIAAGRWHWELLDRDNITHWRMHHPPQPEMSLDDALGEQGAARVETTFEKMADKLWESMPKLPETTYEPLPVPPSQNTLVASIFNTLYPEPCALREVHVEALKAIVKLVEERGGE